MSGSPVAAAVGVPSALRSSAIDPIKRPAPAVGHGKASVRGGHGGSLDSAWLPVVLQMIHLWLAASACPPLSHILTSYSSAADRRALLCRCLGRGPPPFVLARWSMCGFNPAVSPNDPIIFGAGLPLEASHIRQALSTIPDDVYLPALPRSLQLVELKCSAPSLVEVVAVEAINPALEVLHRGATIALVGPVGLAVLC